MSANHKHFRFDYGPLKFQLTKSDIVHFVVVPCRAKLDILMIFRIPESKLRCLIKATDNVIQVIKEGRVGEET